MGSSGPHNTNICTIELSLSIHQQTIHPMFCVSRPWPEFGWRSRIQSAPDDFVPGTVPLMPKTLVMRCPWSFFTRYGAPENIWLQFLPKICSMGPILLFYDCFRIRIVSPTNSDTLITPSWHSNVLKTSKMYKEQFIKDHPRPQNWKRQYNCAVLWHVHRSPCCSFYIGGAPRTFGAGCEQ